MPGLIDTIERRPQASFAAFLALHLVLWTALPALLYPNLPLDLIEALTYGREWQLGYDKLPPLPWWLIEIVHRLIGADVAYYALAQVAVIAAFAAVWMTAVPLVGPVGALVAVLILDGLHYFHHTAAKFNHDVIQLPLWALAGWAFHSGLRNGRAFPWAVLGFAIGLALWAKYFVIVLALPLALFLLLDRRARKSLATPGPWIALAIALIVMTPHLLWLVRNDFLPFAYASARAAPTRSLFDHLLHPVVFALGQLVFLLPALLIAAALFWPRRPQDDRPPPVAADEFDRRIVTLLAFGPFATTVALSAISGRGTIAMWGYPLWLYLGLWIVLQVRGVESSGTAPKSDRLATAAISPVQFARVAKLWTVVFAVFAIAFIANYSVLPRFDHRYRAVFYPGDRLADELARRFRAATGRPLVLRDRQHVGWRQRRPLRARTAARFDRRRSAPRSLDRPGRPAVEGRGGGVGRRRSERHPDRAARRGRRCPGATAIRTFVSSRWRDPHRRLGHLAAAARVCRDRAKRDVRPPP